MTRGKTGPQKHKYERKSDPYLDRRSGEDRRKVYSLDYFLKGGPDRRHRSERRSSSERRHNCIRINKWSSVCPDKNELSDGKPYILSFSRTSSQDQ
ncbi:MAG: hypothetical protein V2I36_05790 [Desulfopila sp.]|jgi:hypothetical protein|nr:hypothetical protein [Desulfopila sp.]